VDQSRRIDVGANVEGRDLGSAVSAVEDRIAGVDLPREYHMEVLGESSELAAAQKSLLIYGIAVALLILFLLQASFGSLRLALLLFLTLPMALVGGVLAVWMGGGILSLGSLIGFLTVFGIAARDGILMISHFQHLEHEEGELAVAGSIAGHEIEHPMAIVILGGLVTSTLLNLFVLPSLYLRFGKSKRERVVQAQEA
jgi:Cu/Ag efflux pump CusA